MYDDEERLRSALHDAAPHGWSVQFEPVARRARVRRNVRAVTAAGASALAVVVVIVTATSLVPAGGPTPPPAAGRTTEGKPTLGQTGGNCVRAYDPALVQIDWVDFVRLNGREYRAIPDHVRADQVGAAVGKVGCMFSDTLPGPDHVPQDGDAAFLAVGTLVHALKGYPPSVRVVAQRPDGQWTVYQVSQR